MLVQFGNNWIQKIPRTANSSEFFSSNYFQIGQACSPITYTNHERNTKQQIKHWQNIS